MGYIIDTHFKDISYVIQNWRRSNPGQTYEDKQIWTETSRAGSGADGLGTDVTYYQ